MRFAPGSLPYALRALRFALCSLRFAGQVLRPMGQHARHYLRRSFFIFILKGFHYLFVETEYLRYHNRINKKLTGQIDIKGIDLISEIEISCCAGEDFMTLIDFAADNSLTGLEFAAGIAGTVGGAVAGNAGAYGGEIKDVLTEITIVDSKGEIKKLSTKQCQFEYRSSYFKNSNDIITCIKIKLDLGDSTTIKDKIEEILLIRRSKHPVDGKTAGSFFKNIIDPNEKYGKIPAGRLLEEAGVKGLMVGGAAVYEKHANMIINKNNATSKDIRDLADILKQKVFDKFGITLEDEVVSLGEF